MHTVMNIPPATSSDKAVAPYGWTWEIRDEKETNEPVGLTTDGALFRYDPI
jgi:hypothetical protein